MPDGALVTGSNDNTAKMWKNFLDLKLSAKICNADYSYSFSRQLCVTDAPWTLSNNKNKDKDSAKILNLLNDILSELRFSDSFTDEHDIRLRKMINLYLQEKLSNMQLYYLECHKNMLFDVLAQTSFDFGASEEMRDYLDVLGLSNPFIRNDEGETLLHNAAFFGNIALVDYLLEKGMPIELSCQTPPQRPARSRSTTPLHYAILGNQAKCVEYLLKKGANINAEDNTKMKPLQVSAEKGFIECVKILLAYGAQADELAPHPKTLALQFDKQSTALLFDSHYHLLQALSEQSTRMEKQQEQLIIVMKVLTEKLFSETDRKSSEAVISDTTFSTQAGMQQSQTLFSGAPVLTDEKSDINRNKQTARPQI